MSDEDIEKSINNLFGETIALQTLMVELMIMLRQAYPLRATDLARVFNNSADLLTAASLKFGDKASPDHLVHSIRVVEELRSNFLSP